MCVARSSGADGRWGAGRMWIGPRLHAARPAAPGRRGGCMSDTGGWRARWPDMVQSNPSPRWPGQTMAKAGVQHSQNYNTVRPARAALPPPWSSLSCCTAVLRCTGIYCTVAHPPTGLPLTPGLATVRMYICDAPAVQGQRIWQGARRACGYNGDRETSGKEGTEDKTTDLYIHTVLYCTVRMWRGLQCVQGALCAWTARRREWRTARTCAAHLYTLLYTQLHIEQAPHGAQRHEAACVMHR